MTDPERRSDDETLDGVVSEERVGGARERERESEGTPLNYRIRIWEPAQGTGTNLTFLQEQSARCVSSLVFHPSNIIKESDLGTFQLSTTWAMCCFPKGFV